MPNKLPPQANLDHIKKQAKHLLKSAQNGDKTALERFSKCHPKHSNGVNRPENLKLHEAQLVIAREFDLASWSQLVLAFESDRQAKTNSPILVITNGLSAVRALELADLPGRKEEWLEVLHDGPVPQTKDRSELNRIRARHIASLGWSSEEGAYQRFKQRDRLLALHSNYDQLQLWFEHDLFDQLQLLQILDTVSEIPEWHEKTVLIQSDHFLAELPSDTLAEKVNARISIDRSHLHLAKRAWNVFRSSEQSALPSYVETETFTALPHLEAALKRLLEERPDPKDGLGRTERQILEAVAVGSRNPGAIFRFSQQMEEAAFMGDLSFFSIVDRLTSGIDSPLLVESHPSLFANANPLSFDSFKERTIHLSDTGLKIVAGQQPYRNQPYSIGGCRFP